jgi:membrane-bound serine protease (ClpP class)
MIGEVGITRTALEPEGQVLVRGEIWDAVASASVPAGARVRVKALAGLKLLVEPLA